MLYKKIAVSHLWQRFPTTGDPPPSPSGHVATSGNVLGVLMGGAAAPYSVQGSPHSTDFLVLNVGEPDSGLTVSFLCQEVDVRENKNSSCKEENK